MTVSEQLREQIRSRQGTVYALSLETGIANPILFRFVSGERGLSMATIDKLAEFFRLELTPKAMGKAPNKPSKPSKAKGKGKPTARPQAKPKPKGGPAVARVRRFVDDYGIAQDVGGRVNHLPRGHVKRATIADMLRWARNEPSLRAWRRRGEYR